jgi:hypothetical protein
METTFLNQERYLLHTFVNSSNLAFAKYDTLMNILELTFQNGTQYSYHGISKETYDELVTSNSAGAYFSTVIRKNKYSRIK